jgi:Ca-activated chloride channel family protein
MQEHHEPEPNLEPLDSALRQAVDQARDQEMPAGLTDRCVARARGAVTEVRAHHSFRRRVLWNLAAMAACLLVGVSVGYLTAKRGDLELAWNQSAPQPAVLVDNSTSPMEIEKYLPAADPTAPDNYIGNTEQLKKIADNQYQHSTLLPTTTTAGQPGQSVQFYEKRNGDRRESYGRPGERRQPMGPAHPLLAGNTPSPLGDHPVPGKLKLPSPADPQRPAREVEAEDPQHNTEQYKHIPSNSFQLVSQHPLSTFSTDVDTASYSLMRRFLMDQNQLPPPDAVRIEELVNYFDYDYPQPKGDAPVSMIPEVSACPWNKDHRLVRFAIQARRLKTENTPPRNLVFLVDVSGSMAPSNRLPLVKEALGLLIDQLTAKDRVSLVVYAGQAGVALPATTGDQKETIRAAVNSLGAGGSTNGAGGIVEAYKEAHKNFNAAGVNRVILCTDGDFNVGVTSEGDLVRLIEEHRNKGVYLTALGFGMGNLKDSNIMKLANHGHGHYAYIDSLAEAKKVFVEEGMSLVTLAQDVKVQVEFNPKTVAAYRLIGYEKRLMRHEDFNDDSKHAAVLGCGHRVTVLFEIAPAGKTVDVATVDPLRYQSEPSLTRKADSDELMTVKIRYKAPMAQKSKLLEAPVEDAGKKFDEASTDFRFAAAVAAFGRILRDKPENAGINLGGVREIAESAKGADARGYRAEFVELVKMAEKLAKSK